MRKIYTLLSILALLIFSASCSKDTELEDIIEAKTLSFTVTEEVVDPLAKGLAGTTCAISTIVADGQYMIGEVAVESDADNLYIIYNSRSNWVIDRTNLYVGDCLAIPSYSSGNPRLSSFPYKGVHAFGTTKVVYSIPLTDIEDCFCIVAHSFVTKVDSSGNQIQCENAYSKGKLFGSNNEAMKANYCKNGCTKVADGPVIK